MIEFFKNIDKEVKKTADKEVNKNTANEVKKTADKEAKKTVSKPTDKESKRENKPPQPPPDPSSCSYTMSNQEAQCYLNRYPDIRNSIGNNVNSAISHWKNTGCKEQRNNQCSSIKFDNSYEYYQQKGPYNFNSANLENNRGKVTSLKQCGDIAINNKDIVFGIDNNNICYTGNDSNKAMSSGYDKSRNNNSIQIYVRDKSFPPPPPPPLPKLSSSNFSSDSHKNNKVNNDLYDYVFCDLTKLDQNVKKIPNSDFGKLSPSSTLNNIVNEKSCLSNCVSDNYCTSYTYLPQSQICEKYSTFPNEVHTNSNKNAGYKLNYNLDYNSLSNQQKNSVREKCSNQYFQNHYGINDDLYNCYTIESNNSTFSFDPECTYKIMEKNGKGSSVHTQTYVDDNDLMSSISNLAIDEFVREYTTYNDKKTAIINLDNQHRDISPIYDKNILDMKKNLFKEYEETNKRNDQQNLENVKAVKEQINVNVNSATKLNFEHFENQGTSSNHWINYYIGFGIIVLIIILIFVSKKNLF